MYSDSLVCVDLFRVNITVGTRPTSILKISNKLIISLMGESLNPKNSFIYLVMSSQFDCTNMFLKR